MQTWRVWLKDKCLGTVEFSTSKGVWAVKKALVQAGYDSGITLVPVLCKGQKVR